MNTTNLVVDQEGYGEELAPRRRIRLGSRSGDSLTVGLNWLASCKKDPIEVYASAATIVLLNDHASARIPTKTGDLRACFSPSSGKARFIGQPIAN